MNPANEIPLLLHHLRVMHPVDAEPPADLWARIAAAHVRRVGKRRRLRYAAGTVFAIALVSVLTFVGLQPRPNSNRAEEAIDWQARAQALELQLAALDRSRPGSVAGSGDEVEVELSEVDRLLQTAYESGQHASQAHAAELAPLWKRRSELLDTLIVTRKQGLALTRI